jgi:hypothetical protein
MATATKLWCVPSIQLGSVTPNVSSITTRKYCDHPEATVAAPNESSSMRSQPIIHAISSPRLAYENVYAEPATGTVEANSA